jgi:hypothetical protein
LLLNTSRRSMRSQHLQLRRLQPDKPY